MLGVKEDRWFVRLDDDSPNVKWMWRVYPQVDYTQAPWKVVMLGSQAKASTLQGRHRRFAGGFAFHMSFLGLLLLATQQKWYHHHLQQQFVQSLIPHNYIQNIRLCTKQTVCSTHTKLNCLHTTVQQSVLV